MNTTHTQNAHACSNGFQRGPSQILVWQNNRRCISCGAILQDNDHVATYYVVNRTLHILLNHGFVSSLTTSNGRITKEVVFAKNHAVDQERLEFRLPESLAGATEVRCSVRWFKLDERADYQYLNKSSGRVLNNKQVPEAARSVAGQLAIANTQPGSLRFTEVNLAGDFEGRKFIRMEQSYALDEATAHDTSLILRVEFSWQ